MGEDRRNGAGRRQERKKLHLERSAAATTMGSPTDEDEEVNEYK